MNKSAVIGIAGPSCAGKTLLAERLAARVPGAIVFPADAYYRDLSHWPMDKRARANFDEPAAIDHTLLVEHLRLLRTGQAVERPRYDFSRHVRLTETQRVEPAGLIIVEGLFGLFWPELRALMDAMVFVSAPDEECLARRTLRDVRDRGRTPESVRAQYEGTVRPMYERWCEPSREHADLVLDGCEEVDGLVERVVGLLRGKGLVFE